MLSKGENEMSEYNVKNYTETGGEVTRIGGSLIIEEGASIEGLPDSGSESEYELPVASASMLGGVKVGEGLAISDDGVLSASGYELPVASQYELGGVKVGSGLSISGTGMLSVNRNEIEVEFPVATNNSMGIVKAGKGLMMIGDGEIMFDSSTNNRISIQRDPSDDSFTVYMPPRVSRSDLDLVFESRKNTEFCVRVYEGGSVETVVADMVCMGGYDDNRAYFHGYGYIGNGVLREYIIGISATDNVEEIDDLLIIRDFTA